MFTASEIAEVTGGRLVGADVTVTGVSTDTRTIEKGMLFVAVRGESFDGNDFINAAAEKGAAAVISDREEGAESHSVPVILVKDSRAAQLALDSGKPFGKMKDEICSPGGTTIAGVRVLEQRGFRAAAMDAVIAASERAKDLA